MEVAEPAKAFLPDEPPDPLYLILNPEVLVRDEVQACDVTYLGTLSLPVPN